MTHAIALALLAVVLGLTPTLGLAAGKDFVIGLSGDATSLNPVVATDGQSYIAEWPLFDSLVELDQTLNVKPLLAESWEVSRDGLTYTFKLKRGVKWHDGKPFTARDVAFTFYAVLDPKVTTPHRAYFDALAGFPELTAKENPKRPEELAVRPIEVVDDHTVRFRLRYPSGSFLAVLTNPRAGIVPEHLLKGVDLNTAEFNRKPVGTGPFRFASWDRGQRVVLEKNPTYWKQPVKVERVIYRPIVEDQARLTELMTGGLDLIVGVPADYVSKLEQSPNVSILKQTGAHVWYLGINNQKKPFDDKRVRQALNYAVNKDAIVRDVLKGTGTLSKGPVLPGTWGADAALKAYPYDPEKAKKLLAEAGYPNGFSTTLWVPESGSGMQAPVAMSTVMQSNLKAVGVNVTLQTMEWGAYLTKLRSKEQDLFALSWMAGTEDPDMVMYPLLHSSQWTPVGPNRALYKNARFDELLQQARLTTDQAKRAQLYKEAQRILVDDAPWVFVDHEIQIAAFTKRVQGFKLHPSFDLRVETISLK